jgi:glycosyltransferase involved in cell wall biosynthesis
MMKTSAQAAAAVEPITEGEFHSVSVILPVMTETATLLQTYETIEQSNSGDVLEYLLVVCDRTAPDSLAACQALVERDRSRVRVITQTLPFLGGAMRDAFDKARGSHVVMMASDLETDPIYVSEMVAQAKANPRAIVTCSRWRKGGGFAGYSRTKLICNSAFQKLFSLLYRQRLTDMTYGYRLFPTRLVQSIRWEELRHPFLFETLLKPLRLGVRVIEIPAFWRARTEGASQNTFARNFAYFPVGFRTLRYRPADILKPQAVAP